MGPIVPTHNILKPGAHPAHLKMDDKKTEQSKDHTSEKKEVEQKSELKPKKIE